MPSNKEIAEWLESAAEFMTTHGFNYGYEFYDRAALVEQMRCETCRWWQQESTEYSIPANSYCINPKTNVGNPRGDRARVISNGPQFCCCHWELKE